MSGDNFASTLQSKMEIAKQVSEEEKLHKYKGVLYPRIICPEGHLKALDGFAAREDDVMLVAYPKCEIKKKGLLCRMLDVLTVRRPFPGGIRAAIGCVQQLEGFNWMVAVLRKIIAEATAVKTAANPPPPLIEFMGPEGLKATDQNPSPRFLGTHLHPDNIPASFYQNKTKMLVVFRNPKDTVVSYFHFSNKNPILQTAQSWETFFSNFMSGDVPWGSYFDHALGWDKKMDDPNVMVVTFEELKQDLGGSIRQISSFFGFSLTDDQVQKIQQESTFSAMSKTSTSSHGNMGNVFFRKGEVGDWKNHFSPEQSREMDDAFDKHLAGTRLGAKLGYQLYCQ